MTPKPIKNRVEKKQSTNKEPDVRVVPHKTHKKQFFVIELYSQAAKGIGSRRAVIWTGTELGLRQRMEEAIVLLGMHQFDMYGDVWDLSELRVLVWERYKKLIADFKAVMNRLN